MVFADRNDCRGQEARACTLPGQRVDGLFDTIEPVFGAAIPVPPVVVGQPLAQRLCGGCLERSLKRGEDFITPGVQVRKLADELLAYPLRGEWRGHLRAAAEHFSRNGSIHGGPVLRLVDRALAVHARQHQVAPAQRTFRSVDGIARRRCLWNAGQHGQLRQSELSERLAVIGARGGFGAIGAFAEGYDIDIQLQNLVLGQLPFHLEREQHLLEFAQEPPFQGERHVARELHGDRARTRAEQPVGQQPAYQADDVVAQRDEIDAAVLIETFVFRVEHGAQKQRRHRLERDRYLAPLAEFSEQHAVGAEHPQRRLQFYVPVALRCRNLRVQIKENARQTEQASAE